MLKRLVPDGDNKFCSQPNETSSELPDVWCSTPGTTGACQKTMDLLRQGKVLRLTTLENIPATPIPCPEPTDSFIQCTSLPERMEDLNIHPSVSSVSLFP
ncbi:hypothetical protein D915_008130 [Fasciola hepatica]|uniref:Uncharacterized protein n=1 Tax=Fasciola hepatica TaxID=6192 RepID=A0A4E0R5B1_FASHE|nr:hypothetical protein D915_008130 [Fasciola hepatica]